MHKKWLTKASSGQPKAADTCFLLPKKYSQLGELVSIDGSLIDSVLSRESQDVPPDPDDLNSQNPELLHASP